MTQSKLPPAQVWVAPHKWPVVGENMPRRDDRPWTLQLIGCISQSRTWSLPALCEEFPWVERAIDIHCVTRWSKADAQFGGIRLMDILAEYPPSPGASFLSFVARSDRNHSTSLTLTDVYLLDPLLAMTYEGQPLAEQHGGPLRVIVPQRYFYKSLKWLETIEFLEQDRLGYWESEAGYHNIADPWQEQRYISRDISRSALQRILQERNMSGQHLLSLQAAHLDLDRLQASFALLRNANFRNTQLQHANFAQANLSNANLQGANLRFASFVGADLEGANFCGADLRSACFTGASLFGATFCPEEGSPSTENPALLDATTLFDATSWRALSEQQQIFLQSHIPGTAESENIHPDP